MKFAVRNKKQIESENYVLQVPHLIISIWSPGHELAHPKTNEHTLRILHLGFHDLDYMPEPGAAAHDVLGRIQLFDENMARDVRKFVEFYPEAKTIVCQCEAGISRSAAIAAALSKHLNGHDDAFFRNYLPNALVYRVLLKELQNGQETRPGIAGDDA